MLALSFWRTTLLAPSVSPASSMAHSTPSGPPCIGLQDGKEGGWGAWEECLLPMSANCVPLGAASRVSRLSIRPGHVCPVFRLRHCACIAEPSDGGIKMDGVSCNRLRTMRTVICRCLDRKSVV